VLKSVGRPLAGKTGTTNEEKDAWFIGYSPDLVVGVFVGYDTPTPMGKFQTGGKVAAPIFGAFMQQALVDTPPAPFRVPPGLKLMRVNLRTGLRASADDPTSIMEAFKPGEEPDDAYSVIGFTGSGDEGVPPPEDDAYGEPQRQRPPTFGAGRGGLW
jgi:penicillin-binding protein 1A